jgi:hypothetical protein
LRLSLLTNLAATASRIPGGASEAVATMAQPTAEPAEDYDYESLPPNFSLLQNMAAGAFAGIAEHSVMYPIDAIKVRAIGSMATLTTHTDALILTDGSYGARIDSHANS